MLPPSRSRHSSSNISFPSRHVNMHGSLDQRSPLLAHSSCSRQFNLVRRFLPTHYTVVGVTTSHTHKPSFPTLGKVFIAKIRFSAILDSFRPRKIPVILYVPNLSAPCTRSSTKRSRGWRPLERDWHRETTVRVRDPVVPYGRLAVVSSLPMHPPRSIM